MKIDTCPFCREDVTDDDFYLHEITGWEKTRAEGGANAIRLRQRTGKKAHQLCVERAGKGLTGQQGLWRE